VPLNPWKHSAKQAPQPRRPKSSDTPLWQPQHHCTIHRSWSESVSLARWIQSTRFPPVV